MNFEEELEQLFRAAADPSYVPESLQPFTPVEFYLPEISSMRLVKDAPLLGGRHVEVRMANGWGVSIVNHWGAFGGLEVGFRPPGPHEINGLGTPPFHDDEVMGYLDQRSLIEVLSKVHHLPKERDDRQGTTDRGSDEEPEGATGDREGVQRGDPDQ